MTELQQLILDSLEQELVSLVNRNRIVSHETYEREAEKFAVWLAERYEKDTLGNHYE